MSKGPHVVSSEVEKRWDVEEKGKKRVTVAVERV